MSERIIVIRAGRGAPAGWFRSIGGAPNHVVLIHHEVFLDVSDVPAAAKPWELREVVTIARCIAVKEGLGRDVPLAFTSETGLVLQGFSTWWNVPDIHYRAPVSRRRKITLPPVRISGRVIPAVSACHIAGPVTSPHSDPLLSVVPDPAIISDLAVTSHPLQVFVGTCSLVAVRSKFHRYWLPESRSRELRVKTLLLHSLRQVGKRWGSRLAIDTVMAADAGIDSPAEAALLWGLHCLLPPRKRAALKTQHRVCVGDRTYFLDVSIPGIQAAIEPDGASKFAGQPEVYAAQKNDFIRRNQALASAGWKIGHIPAVDLGNQKMLETIHRVAADVKMVPDDPAAQPKGPLWRPLTGHLFSAERRF